MCGEIEIQVVVSIAGRVQRQAEMSNPVIIVKQVDRFEHVRFVDFQLQVPVDFSVIMQQPGT